MNAPRPQAIFLPGIVMPAALRYAPLLKELGESTDAVTKELEVYGGPAPPAGYSIQTEIDGISRAADAAGFERFHLYGHSAGGACALAYAAANSDRVLTLALDEPATDFTPEYREEIGPKLAAIQSLPEGEQMRAFLRLQLAEGFEPPAPPGGPPPEWMANRPGGIDAFGRAIEEYELDYAALRGFPRPVYYSHGSLSNPVWQRIRDRLAGVFPNFTSDLYEGIHHLNTSHQAAPARVAAALRRLWSQT